MKKRPQNFNADGSVKSPKQRVESGTANDTDKLMALEGEEREVAFANERAKSKVQGDVAQRGLAASCAPASPPTVITITDAIWNSA